MTEIKRITAGDLAKNKVLIGLDGKILVNVNHIRKFIAKKHRFASYKLTPWPHAPRGAHTIDIDEVQMWNDSIIQSLKENAEAFKAINPYGTHATKNSKARSKK